MPLIKPIAPNSIAPLDQDIDDFFGLDSRRSRQQVSGSQVVREKSDREWMIV
jgi:hypothetical protein